MDLLKRANELSKIAFKGSNKAKKEKHRGFFIEHFYGKPKWTPKDLTEEELKDFVSRLEERLKLYLAQSTAHE